MKLIAGLMIARRLAAFDVIAIWGFLAPFWGLRGWF